MKQHGDMKTVLSLRGQYPMLKTDFDTSVAGFMDNIVYVDWIRLGSSLLIVISRPRGRIDYEELGNFHDLLRNLHNCFHEGDLRNKSPQRIFGQLEDIIKPLQSYKKPGETLVLSPTESMHRLPLHALKLKGEPLIKRNPIVYSYSASLMAICAERRNNSKAYRDGKSIVIGNPKADSVKIMAAASMDKSSKQLQTGTDFISPTCGMRNSDFKSAAEGAAILHYHGHAKYKSDSAAEAVLVLTGDDILTPKDVNGLQLQEGAHVTLIACYSGKQGVSLGNEPLGIVPAFLVAGASSVLATLWPIPSTAGQKFSESFYQHGLAKGADGQMRGQVDLARALQQATLDVLDV
ncbi:NAD(P)-binding domain [Fusarium agapanthi]|uniref:NAD(P)-binding domain n=1 Tax=Fusarium agapanthi TaxID=1803897 RepID=A0A9P5E511_9HYPO|nr:NAD(P)-binding domain [Fusarium agapanthi]